MCRLNTGIINAEQDEDGDTLQRPCWISDLVILSGSENRCGAVRDGAAISQTLAKEMEISFDTANIWQIDTDVDPQRFVEALDTILQVGDVVVFGAYQPTPELSRHLIATGAIKRSEIPELHTSFDLNRDEHPDGCAFELCVSEDTFESLMAPGPDVIRQRDLSRFFDHVVAYRPATPRVPLLSFHDAFHGGSLFLSGAYDETVVRLFCSQVAGSITSVSNLHMTQTEEG